MMDGLESMHSNVMHLRLENPPIFLSGIQGRTEQEVALAYHNLKGLLENSIYPSIKQRPQWYILPHYLTAYLKEHLLVSMSCDLIPDHHILHQPFGIQPRIIMAYLYSSELPQVLAL